MRLAELLVLPDRGADRIDEVHLAGAEQVVLDRGGPLHEVPGGVLLVREAGQRQRPDPDVRRRRRSRRVGGEGRVADIALLLVVAAIHEVAEDVGVEDHGRGAGAEIGADLVPGVGRPVLRARIPGSSAPTACGRPWTPRCSSRPSACRR